MIGRTLEHYRIESKLGQGGMGVVYRAHDARLNRPVAIKILPPEKLPDPTTKQRFVREAKAASALHHPGIVTIHDICSDAGVDFIVMEWIDGKTLAEVIPSKGMRAVQALRYGVQMADALAAAHGAGILHRDLKPSNVMITHEGRIKILDFGLAKILESSDASSDATTVAAPLTEERTLVGTTAYMSPEQAEGRKLDARADIFSFGTVLYEMTTGQRPFTGDSSLSVLTRILNEDPKPPADINASIPPELEKTILRCLRKDPGRRYQTMADLKVARGPRGGNRFQARGAAVDPCAVAVAPGMGAVVADRAGGELRRMADVASRRTGGAASGSRTHHVSGAGALSIPVSRWQLRRVHLDRTEAGQHRHLPATNRRRLAVAADIRSAERL